MAASWEGWLGLKPASSFGLFSTMNQYYASLNPFHGGTGIDVCLYLDEKKTTLKQAIHVPLSPPALLEEKEAKMSFTLTVSGGRTYVFKCRSTEDLAACCESWRRAFNNKVRHQDSMNAFQTEFHKRHRLTK